MLIFKRPSEMEFRQIKRQVAIQQLENDDLKREDFTVLKSDEKLLAFGCLTKEHDYAEMGCIGVVAEKKSKQWEEMIVKKLVSTGPQTIWITTDQPKYFEKFNFEVSAQIPKTLSRRISQREQSPGKKLKVMMLNKRKA